MKKYESVIIVKPNLSKNKFDEISKKIDNKINEVAKNINKQDYGQKTLAYEINQNKEVMKSQINKLEYSNEISYCLLSTTKRFGSTFKIKMRDKSHFWLRASRDFIHPTYIGGVDWCLGIDSPNAAVKRIKRITKKGNYICACKTFLLPTRS